jgi:hypothetical protein
MGGALFMWADYFLRQWGVRFAQMGWHALSPMQGDRKLASMTLMFIFATELILSAIWFAFERKSPEDTSTVGPVAARPPTSSQSPGHDEPAPARNIVLPVETSMANVARWYALANVVVVVAANGKRNEIKTWNIFIAFERSIDTRQVLVKSKDALPRYEVKGFSPKSAVIAFLGDLVDVSLEIAITSNASTMPGQTTLIAKPGAVTTAANVPGPTSQLPMKPRYNDGEIRKLIDVMASLREMADAKIAPKTWELSEYRNSWERKLRDEGVESTATYVEGYAEPIRGALNEINKILYDNQHYEDQVRPVVGDFGAISVFHSSTVDLARELREYVSAQNVNVGKILGDRFQQWFQASNNLGHWIGQTDVRITAKTKELREWNP